MASSLASFVLTGGLAVLGAGAVIFHAPQAQAICNGGNNICDTFNPVSDSTVVSRGGFTGNYNSTTYTQALIKFDYTGFTPPFLLTGISLSGDGISTPLLLSDVTISTGTGSVSTLFGALNTNPTSVNFANSLVSFTIPSGIGPTGSTLTARIQYADGTLQNPNTTNFSSTNFTTRAVPSPLPLLGAGVAFSFSRTLRKRIKASTKA